MLIATVSNAYTIENALYNCGKNCAFSGGDDNDGSSSTAYCLGSLSLFRFFHDTERYYSENVCIIVPVVACALLDFPQLTVRIQPS